MDVRTGVRARMLPWTYKSPVDLQVLEGGHGSAPLVDARGDGILNTIS